MAERKRTARKTRSGSPVPASRPGGLPAAAVFISGLAFMALEIMGSRLIQIHFGSTVYVWGAIIGVFLLTSAMGNIWGGRLADRRPAFGLLAGLLALAGLWIALIPYWQDAPGRWLTSTTLLGRGLGALLLALLLFAVPALLMGATTPFVIRLTGRRLDQLGDLSGRLYAFSNAGSILGVVLSAFLAVRHLGNRLSLTLLGSLLLLSMLLLALSRRGVNASEPAETVETKKPESGPPGREPPRHTSILFLLAVAGAALMSTQMAGSLVMQVYFASTIYVWGAIIAVFMLGMTLGNIVGGRIADRFPAFSSLGLLLALAGAWILSVPAWQQALQEWFVPMPGEEAPLSPVWGAFGAALCLYGPPSLLIGAAIPCGVRLTAQRLGRLGGSAGLLFGLFNLGSIAGTLLTSFVLLEFMGHRAILAGAGTVLVLSAVTVSLLREPRFAKQQLVYGGLTLALAALCAWPSWRALAGPGFSLLMPGKGVIRHSESSPYQRIVIAEDYFDLAFKPPTDPAAASRQVYAYDDGGADDPRPGLAWNRALCYFNRMAQSRVYVNGGPDRDDLPPGLGDGMSSALYTYAFQAASALLPEGRPRRVLVLGGGGLIVPRQFHDLFPATEGEDGVVVDAVEIDPQVNDLAVEYFFPAERPYETVYRDRVRLFAEDGRQFLVRRQNRDGAGAVSSRYDLILVDVYTAGGRVPFHMATQEFFALCRANLAPGGVLAVNLLDAVEGPSSRLFRAIYKTLATSPDLWSPETIHVLRPGARTVGLDEVDNIILLMPGTGTPVASDDFIARADELAARFNARPGSDYERSEAAAAAGWLRRFARQTLPDGAAIECSDVPVLTDDHAPVDFLVEGMN